MMTFFFQGKTIPVSYDPPGFTAIMSFYTEEKQQAINITCENYVSCFVIFIFKNCLFDLAFKVGRKVILLKNMIYF